MRFYVRRLALCLLTPLLFCALAGCVRLVPEQSEPEPALSVYASFYPIYALTQMITDGISGVEAHCLVQPQDGCLREYDLSDWDLRLIEQAADVVILGGNGLEAFEDWIFALGDSGPAVITAFSLDALLSGDAGAYGEAALHWDGINPHAYMSVSRVSGAAEAIAEGLATLDPAHASLYQKNLESAQARLEDLQAQLHAGMEAFAGEKVILLNEALLYTAQEFSLDVDGWYPRESGTDFSENELEDCIKALSECSAKTILVEKQAPEALCTALEARGYAVARVDIFSTGREEMGAEGYFSGQLENVRSISAAFFAALAD